MYNFYLGITYRTVGKIAPTLAGVKEFWKEFSLRISVPRKHVGRESVDVTQVRMYKCSYRTVGKWI